MAVAFRSATSVGNAINTTTRAPAVPTGAAAGDIGITIIGFWDAALVGGTPTITPPTGWVQRDTFTSGDGLAKNTVWWKRLTAADSGTYSWTFSITGYSTVEVLMFSGCVTYGDPFDGNPVKATASAATTYPSLSSTLSDPNGGLVWGCYNDDASTHTPPTNFTEAIDDDCGSCAYWIPGSSGSKTASGATTGVSSVLGAWMAGLLSTSMGQPAFAAQAGGAFACF